MISSIRRWMDSRSARKACAAGMRSSVISRKTVMADELVRSYPPVIFSANKQLVYDMACPEGCRHAGSITVSRWRPMSCPPSFPATRHPLRLVVRQGSYSYEPTGFRFGNRDADWFVNFADRDLFCAYGGSLFAQDEMQVAEHPALGSLKEMLGALTHDDDQMRPHTRDSEGRPTPILITDVERRLAITVEPNPPEMPQGLYGKSFGRAPTETIRAACRVIEPPPRSNIIAMTAPRGENGVYTREEIADAFQTAFTAFQAARIETRAAFGRRSAILIHTGNWGTGAYGGNRVLMALLQMAAAHASGIHCLVYHAFDRQHVGDVRKAEALFAKTGGTMTDVASVPHFLEMVHGMGFEWGVPDGN